MANRSYNHGSYPPYNSFGNSSELRTELDAVDTGFAEIEGELDTKAIRTGDAYTGTHDFTAATVTVAAPAAAANPVTKEYADNLSFSSTLPAQTGNDYKVLRTVAGVAGWTAIGSANQFIKVKSDGTGLEGVTVPGGLVHLSTVTAANSATVDVETTFDATYSAYMVVGSGITYQNDGVGLDLRMKVGGSYDTGANYASHAMLATSESALYAGDAQPLGASRIVMSANSGNAAGEVANFKMMVYEPASTTLKKLVSWEGVVVDATSGGVKMASGVGMNASISALTGLRFYASGGNIATGTFRLYGIANS